MNYIRGEKIPPLNDWEKQRVSEEFEFFAISYQIQKK